LRVLKPGGRVALVWNFRRRSGTPFLETYERLLGENAGQTTAATDLTGCLSLCSNTHLRVRDINALGGRR